MTTRDPAERPDVEQWLDRFHIPWTYEPAFPIAKLDMKASLQNQAREHPLDDGLVADYTLAIRNGDVFPAVIARKVGRRHVLLGGNHRTTAATNNNRTTIPTYLVTVDSDAAALRVAYEDNAKHGKKSETAERIRQTVHLVEACDFALADAARLLNISTTSITHERGARAAIDRARDLNISTTAFAALPRATRYELSQLVADPVFEGAATLAIDANLTSPDVKTLCRTLKTARSETAALTTIERARTERRADLQAAAGKTSRPARKHGATNEANTFQTHVWGIAEGPGPARVAATCAGPEHARRLAKDIAKAMIVLDATRTELKRRP